jgi:hypothetical protein
LVFDIEIRWATHQNTEVNRRILFILLLFVSVALKSGAQGTAFNYQGRLNDSGMQANGSYDLRFAVYDAVTNGTRISDLLTNSAVAVSNGLFSVNLDFGAGIFAGNNAWLDLAVRATGVTNFTSLSPRQPILPVPYAMFSTTASNLVGTLSAAQLTGTVPSSQVSGTYSNPVNFTNGGNNFSGAFGGTFSGNGSALTSLNASQLTTGTVADARLTTNVALLDHSQTYSGANTYGGDNTFNGANNFTNRANNFTGSFFGNGNVGWIVVSNTAVTASANHGYLLTNPQFTSVVLPPGTNLLISDIIRISGAGVGGWWVGQGTNQIIIGNFFGYRLSLWLPASVSGVSWHSLAASADGTLMYAAGAGGVFSSTDAGHTWSGPVSSLAGQWSSVATSADGQTVLAAAVTANKPVQISTNTGAAGSWKNAPGSSSVKWAGIACSADGKKIIAAQQSGFVFTNNSAIPANSWSSVNSATGSNWGVVTYAGNGNNYAASSSNGNVYSKATGANVNLTNQVVTGLVISADGTKLAACVSPGGIYTSTNSGATWTNTTAPWTAWNCLAASADCTRLMAGVSNGVIYASANFGGNWTPLTGASNQVWSALAASADGTKVAGAVNTITGGIYYSSATGQSTTSTNGTLTGSQSTAVELQYIGNNQFMPVSTAGTLWAN